MKHFLLTVTSICLATVIQIAPGHRLIHDRDINKTPQIQKLEFGKTPIETIRTQAVGFDKVMLDVGAKESELEGLRYIFGQESGFCHTKWENQRTCPAEYPGDIYSPYDSTKGYGYCQATPAIKYEQEGADWRNNPHTQARWCYKYAQQYGSVDAAVQFKRCMGSCYSPRTNSTVFKVTPWF